MKDKINVRLVDGVNEIFVDKNIEKEDKDINIVVVRVPNGIANISNTLQKVVIVYLNEIVQTPTVKVENL